MVMNLYGVYYVTKRLLDKKSHDIKGVCVSALFCGVTASALFWGVDLVSEVRVITIERVRCLCSSVK